MNLNNNAITEAFKYIYASIDLRYNKVAGLFCSSILHCNCLHEMETCPSLMLRHIKTLININKWSHDCSMFKSAGYIPDCYFVFFVFGGMHLFNS